jgi:hypothetical protein
MLQIQIINIKKSIFYVFYKYLIFYKFRNLINIYAQWKCFLPQRMDTASGVHPLFYRKATMGYFPEGEAAEARNSELHPFLYIYLRAP